MSDAELVMEVRQGDRGAFGVLAERHRARAYRLARAMLGDAGEAEDVTQDTLFQAYLGIDRLRDPDRFGAWLCGIAANLAKMALRRRRATVSLEDLDGGRRARGFRLEDADPESLAEARQLRRAVQQALDALPADLRATVWLHVVEGLSYREIGAMWGVAPGTLRVRAHRARRRLRQALIDERPVSPAREEAGMIEVDVRDVLLWMPKQAAPAGPGRITDLEPARRCVALLGAREGDRALPIWIGPHEAAMLGLRLAERSPLRPLTYDSMARMFDALGVSVERVAINALQGETFLAVVTVRQGKQAHQIDARPSDALNLAVRAGAPIVVDEGVMQAAGIATERLPDELSRLCRDEEQNATGEYSWRSGRELYTSLELGG